MVEAFEGNKTQTATMIPTITAFKEAHALGDVTVVADAGMVSETNRERSSAGLSFILGAKIAQVPYVVTEWRREHPDQQIPDGHAFTQPWPAGPTDQRRDQVIYYQFRADRARRVLRGIDGQIAKAEKTGASKSPVKRNRFITITGATRSTGRWRPKPARWPGSRATSAISTTRHQSS